MNFSINSHGQNCNISAQHIATLLGATMLLAFGHPVARRRAAKCSAGFIVDGLNPDASVVCIV